MAVWGDPPHAWGGSPLLKRFFHYEPKQLYEDIITSYLYGIELAFIKDKFDEGGGWP